MELANIFKALDPNGNFCWSNITLSKIVGFVRENCVKALSGQVRMEFEASLQYLLMAAQFTQVLTYQFLYAVFPLIWAITVAVQYTQIMYHPDVCNCTMPFILDRHFSA